MKILYTLTILILLLSCSDNINISDNENIKLLENEILKPEFQSIIDSANVKGAILLYDPQKDKYYSNDFEWTKKGHLPASTFKITNSIIAIETGVIGNDSTLIKWNGKKRRMKIWEQDLLFKDAFHFSCVPCYQEIARKIGPVRMKKYLAKFEYGQMEIDYSNIDLFWLEGESQINQYEQIEFLRKFYHSELLISARTHNIMKRLMIIKETDEYIISGKTGWSIRHGNNNGWFVGYIQSQNKVYFFATNIEPKEQFNIDMFPMIRKDLTYKAFNQMKIIN